jgi:hypothetical protein
MWERMRNQLRARYESAGYGTERMNTDGERAEVTYLRDQRSRPCCGPCVQPMRINRETRQSAMDLPLGPASFVRVLHEAVQGYPRKTSLTRRLPKRLRRLQTLRQNQPRFLSLRPSLRTRPPSPGWPLPRCCSCWRSCFSSRKSGPDRKPCPKLVRHRATATGVLTRAEKSDRLHGKAGGKPAAIAHSC